MLFPWSGFGVNCFQVVEALAQGSRPSSHKSSRLWGLQYILQDDYGILQLYGYHWTKDFGACYKSLNTRLEPCCSFASVNH